MDSHLQKLRILLTEQSLDAALITSIPHIMYLTGYAGFLPEEREAYLFITKTHAYIFTNSLYAGEIKQQVTNMTLVEINQNNLFIAALEKLLKKHKAQIIGIEEDNLTAREYKQLVTLSIKIKAIKLNSLRMLKTSNEITAIQKACDIGDKAFAYILTQLKPGVTEKTIAHELDLFMKQNHTDPSFRAIVAFGKNTAVPHHVSGDYSLKTTSCILLDFGVKVGNYCSDMTRTVFIGNATPKQKKVYQIVLDAQKAAITFIEEKLAKKQKIIGREIDNAARKYILDHGFGSFQHGLGHGIGLEIHESPRLSPPSKDMLQSGMVFSIEPGIYLPEDMGVRIEDLFTIQNNKLIQLTKSSRGFIEI